MLELKHNDVDLKDIFRIRTRIGIYRYKWFVPNSDTDSKTNNLNKQEICQK
jgi:hypothetical protein